MKTAIIYSSTHGTTEKVASRLAEILGIENIKLFNLRNESTIDISVFDTVIIGGSIHAGNIQMRIKKFCKINLLALLDKKLGLFMCGMNEPEYEKEFRNAFPELLREHASATCIPGGEFLFDKMNFFQRAIVTKISGIKESVSKIDDSKIIMFADELKN
jgi:menaquinone-dependent protoporphyrinogen oxidase